MHMDNKYHIKKEIFAQRLKQLMEENNETTYSMSEKFHLAPATISRYTTQNMIPKISLIETISRYFRINPVWLMGYDVPRGLSSPETLLLTPEEIDIINKYNKLDEMGKHTIQVIINTEYERCINKFKMDNSISNSDRIKNAHNKNKERLEKATLSYLKENSKNKKSI